MKMKPYTYSVCINLSISTHPALSDKLHKLEWHMETFSLLKPPPTYGESGSLQFQSLYYNYIVSTVGIIGA